MAHGSLRHPSGFRHTSRDHFGVGEERNSGAEDLIVGSLCCYVTNSRCPQAPLMFWSANARNSDLFKPELLCSMVKGLHGRRFNFFRGVGCQADFPIIGDRSIDDCSAIETFPGVEDQKEIREAFQHHQSLALRAIHNSFPPCDYEHAVAGGKSNLRSSTTVFTLSMT